LIIWDGQSKKSPSQTPPSLICFLQRICFFSRQDDNTSYRGDVVWLSSVFFIRLKNSIRKPAGAMHHLSFQFLWTPKLTCCNYSSLACKVLHGPCHPKQFEILFSVSPIERWKKIARQRLPVVKKGLASVYLPCQVQTTGKAERNLEFDGSHL
jgi:hypothetical protein